MGAITEGKVLGVFALAEITVTVLFGCKSFGFKISSRMRTVTERLAF
jgi:hypothetical protein